MFKLVYQAFILFSLANGYMIFRFVQFFKSEKLGVIKRLFLLPYIIVGFVFFYLVASYPFFAIPSYYNNVKIYQGLNGISYLTKTYPTDALGISWLNKYITGQPVILEAQGDSYTEYARVSSNTGLPTVLGWPVHEWLWRGTYDIVPPRSADIQTMYTTTDVKIFKDVAKKYNVKYVFVGQLERIKYPTLTEIVFQKVGKVVFKNGVTTIYLLTF
jgi:uncharacterized membrane protein